jgi:hypothetical protein
VAPATTTTGAGVVTALGVAVGSAGAFVTFNGALGTPSSGTVTNLTGTASININGTVGATTATTGAFTTLAVSGIATFTASPQTDAANGFALYTADAANYNISRSGSTVSVKSAGDIRLNAGGVQLTASLANGVQVAGVLGVTTSLTTPLISGGGAGASTLTLQSTSAAGSSDAIIFKTASQSERMRITTGGNVGIGTSSPTTRLDVDGASTFRAGGSQFNVVIGLTGYQSGFQFNRAGYNNWFVGSDNNSVDLAIGESIASPSMTFKSGGNVGIGVTNPGYKLAVNGAIACISATSGLGYGTGSGGAVTQITSRTTGVTLDKPNGAITLVSAAGSVTYQSFTVTNSTVAATDTVIVSQKSGTDLNMIFVTAVAAGSFRISFATTGGTTTEQPVFNFAVIKAVAA